MRFITLHEVLWLHDRIIDTSGGSTGVRDFGQIAAAVSQPKATFDGADLYPDLLAKAAALAFGLVRGHGFVDGNKRIGHAAMQLFLQLNGWVLEATVDEHERTILDVAAGSMSKAQLEDWLRAHAQPGPPPG